jgi:hypothetical protein
MNWDAISAVSELVGTITVVVTLVYVGLQVRQNTKALVAGSRQGLLDGDLDLISEYIDHSVDPHLIGDDVRLSPEDERRLRWMIIKALRIREFAWHQFQSGLLDEPTWQSYLAPVPTMFATKRAKSVLDFYYGSPEFMAEIRDRLSEGTPEK